MQLIGTRTMSKQNKLCISIRGFKRPEYSKRCLESLESNSDLSGVDFYFFQDGAVNPFSGIRHATDEEVAASLKVFQESDLPNKTIYQSKVNMGAALRNQHQLNTLFPKYKYIVLADNDLIFNRYYIKTLKVLFEQFANDEKAGALQNSFRHVGHYQSKEEAERLENRVTYGFSHFWEIGLWRESWEKIKVKMDYYFETVKQCDFKELMCNADVYSDIRKKLIRVYGSFLNGGFIASEDYALTKSAMMMGYKGIHTLALRHKSIGEKGHYSFKNGRWNQQGFSGINLYDVGNVERYELT